MLYVNLKKKYMNGLEELVDANDDESLLLKSTVYGVAQSLG